ncbi:MAG: glycine cleavage system protein H [bacterium]
MESFLQGQVDKFIFKVPKDCLFHPEETWVRSAAGGGEAQVGVTDYLQMTGGDISFVELPEPGQILEQGKQMGSLETIKAVLPLLSPLSGKVVKINEALLEKPELVNEDPYGTGWMAEITPSGWEEDKKILLPAEDYFSRMMEKARAEMSRLKEE